VQVKRAPAAVAAQLPIIPFPETWPHPRRRAYNSAVPTWLSFRRLLRVGASLLVAAIALGSSLLFLGEFPGGIDSILIVAIPLLLLSTLLGFTVTLIGALGWAFQASVQKLASLGISLIGLGVLCFIIGQRLRFGFDDPGILFMQGATYTPLLVGTLFLLSAGIRHWRATIKTLKPKT
jgi:hypothetical protein